MAFLNLLFEYFLYALTTFGFSLLHGPHQEAQKSIKTILPFKDDSLMLSPFGSLNSSSGAVLPILSPTISCAEIKLMQMIMFRKNNI